MAVHGNAEPRFDLDLKYGREGEMLVGTMLEWISSANGQIEVKRKSYLDWKFYVETHCDKGRRGVFAPSGISVTTAVAWAIVFADTRITLVVPTEELRALLDDPSSDDRAEADGSCPTKGKLVNLSVLLYRHKQRREREAAITRAPVRQPEQCVAPTVEELFGRGSR